MTRRKKKPAKSTMLRFRSCGQCMSGMIRVLRKDGTHAMRYCLCLNAWKIANKSIKANVVPGMDAKERAANA